jgi:hypothetical protein
MQRAFMLSLSAIVLTYAANAAADSLKGDYGITGSGACLAAPAGSDSSFQALGTRIWSSSSATEGIWTFHGDGTGTATGRSIGVTVPPTPGFLPAASSSEFSFSFTYIVHADGTFTVDTVPGTYTGTVLTGPRAGQTFTQANGSARTGVIPRSGNTLTLATLTPGVEFQTYSNGDIIHEICHLSRVLIRLDD